MIDWKTVTVNGVTFTRRILFCLLDGTPEVLSGVQELATRFEGARNRRKYGW